MAENGSFVPAKYEGRGMQPLHWYPFDAMREEMGRFFQDFDELWRLPFRSAVSSIAAGPIVDIVERDDSFEITAEMPGMNERDVEITVSDRSLVIQGEKKEELEEKGGNVHLSERHYGSFQRRFALPDNIDRDAIEARFKNGILTVVMPKTPEILARDKKVEIKAG